MEMPRRRFLGLAACAALLPTRPGTAHAQSYPSRPVRLLVGFPPGATNDLVARLVGQWLSEHLGQPFIVENRPGAGGNIATEAAVRASPDGYTLLLAATSAAISATLYDKLNFNFVRDTIPIASVLRQPHIMLVNSSVSAKTIPEFIAYAKNNPGKFNMASPGNGTGPHMAGELFKIMAGVDLVHVPYRGAPAALTDLLAGRVQLMFPAPAAAIEHIRRGALRPLAVTTATRWEALPAVPTIGEFVPGYEADTWFGIVAPRNTPAEVVQRLHHEINTALADPKLRSRFADFGGGIFASTRADFGRLIADDTEKWGKVVRFAGLKPD